MTFSPSDDPRQQVSPAQAVPQPAFAAPDGTRRRWKSRLWNLAAAAGIFVIGTLVGVVAGVELGQRGFFDELGTRVAQLRGEWTGPAATPTSTPEAPLPATGVALSTQAGNVAGDPTASPVSSLVSSPDVDNSVRDGHADESHFERLYEEPLDRAPPEPLVAADPSPDETEVQGWTTVAALRQQASLPRAVVPRRAPGEPPLWKANAVASPPANGRPMIAIVLDDLGLNRPGARRAIELPAPLTLAFMTYAEGLDEMTSAARRAGHELMVHVPMQPRDATYDPGPNVLAVELHSAELLRRLDWGLGRFSGYVGINNHMGSRFSAHADGMDQVMRELKARGLLFLDSRTAGGTVAQKTAANIDLPFIGRDIFLDNDPGDPASIQRQLDTLERLARERGYAVGIGHPHRNTLAALEQWLPLAEARGLALVPISAIVARRRAHNQDAAGTSG